jgi:hypothetical protein
MELVIRYALLALACFCFCFSGLWMKRRPEQAYRLFSFGQTPDSGFFVGFLRITGSVFTVFFGFGGIAFIGALAFALFHKG